MKATRRSMMLGTTFAALAGAGLLAGCSTPSAGISLAQVLTDASGAVNALLAVVPSVQQAAPKLLPADTGNQVVQALTLAQQLLGTMSAGTPPATAATTLQTVEAAIVQAVSALAAVTPAAAAAFPALAPYVIMIQAAAALLPGLVAFINSVIPATAPPGGQVASLTAMLPAPVMTPAQARAALGIPSI